MIYLRLAKKEKVKLKKDFSRTVRMTKGKGIRRAKRVKTLTLSIHTIS